MECVKLDRMRQFDVTKMQNIEFMQRMYVEQKYEEWLRDYYSNGLFNIKE